MPPSCVWPHLVLELLRAEGGWLWLGGLRLEVSAADSHTELVESIWPFADTASNQHIVTLRLAADWTLTRDGVAWHCRPEGGDKGAGVCETGMDALASLVPTFNHRLGNKTQPENPGGGDGWQRQDDVADTSSYSNHMRHRCGYPLGAASCASTVRESWTVDAVAGCNP